MRIRLLLLVFSAFAAAVQGQEGPFVRQLTDRDGLSHNQVQCLLRDRQGYLWVGTSYGLNRFDGYHFKTYLPDARHPQRSLCHEIVYDLAEDDQGYLWIATRDGLNRYDPHTQLFRTWQNTGRDDGSIPNSIVYDLLPEGPNQLWLCCDNRDLSLMDTRQLSFSTFPWKAYVQQVLPAQASQGYQTIYRLARKSDCELWLFTNLGIFTFDTVSQQFGLYSTQKTDEPPHNRPPIVLHDSEGLHWIGDDTGLKLLDPQLQHFHFNPIPAAQPGLAPTQIHRILDTPDGRRYLLDRAGQQLLVSQKNHPIRRIPLGGQPGILFQDRSQQIWLSAGPTLFLLEPGSLRLQKRDIPTQLLRPDPQTTFSDMAEDSRGNLWFALEDKGLLVWEAKTQKWWKPAEAEGFIAYNLSSILADPQRRTVWIASQDYGLFRYEEDSGRFSIYQKESDRPESSLGAFIVNDLCLDGRGYLWAATDPGGVSRFDYEAPAEQAFTTLNVQNGLVSNQVLSLQTDQAGNVWAGTSQGLSWIDAHSLQLRSFNRNNGLAHDAVQMPISLGSQAEILLGTAGGFTSFYPDSVLAQRNNPRILLNSGKVFETELADSLNLNQIQKLALSWKQNFFVFEFSSVNFSQPDKNEYAYRLKGFTEGWTQNGKLRRAAFTNVPPGEYVFQVRSGREGRWNPVGLQLPIHISPPFWQRWPFIGLVLGLLLLLAWRIWRYRITQIRREEALKTAFNQRIAQVEMSALRAQMNPHFVFNCLSSINRFILVNEPDVASDYLSKFSKLIRLILDNSRAEQVSLGKELEALRLYVELESMRFGHRFDYSLSIASDVNIEQLEIPPLLIQPLVENAIWHGLMHRKDKGRLSLRLFYAQGSLCIEVEDNGIGRALALELKSKSAVRQKSHGLQVTAERLELIRELYGVRAETDIEDLFQPDGTAAGTRATIRLVQRDHQTATSGKFHPARR